ncbi:VOC family protein [Sedimentitalea sp. XS_ASV28]|uniref:VOC family protein n=1 Tax=Sedimentitalea sp. XS_ASV28 TaxID=3241296 RepID=UPI003519540B
MKIASDTSSREGVFDQAVLNLHYELDAGEQLFSSLGFNVTHRGYHTLGSMNHLIVFGTDYLELIGLCPTNPNLRKGLLDWPVGLNGLVAGTVDTGRTYARLKSNKLPALEPKSFSRPVTMDGVETEAKFQTVHLDPGYFAVSRVYFREHLTSALIWTADNQRHPNTATALTRLIIATDDVAGAVGRLAKTFGLEPAAENIVELNGSTRFEFRNKQELTQAYGGSIVLDTSAPKIIGLSIGVASRDGFLAALEPGVSEKLVSPDPGRFILLPTTVLA